MTMAISARRGMALLRVVFTPITGQESANSAGLTMHDNIKNALNNGKPQTRFST
jgi:hypothetical protein